MMVLLRLLSVLLLRLLLVLLHLGLSAITVAGSAMILLSLNVIPSNLNRWEKVVIGIYGLWLVVGLRWAEHERCFKKTKENKNGE